MNLKELKRLAAACRKAGILHFKSADYEFTLSDTQPVRETKHSKSLGNAASDSKFESDSLSPEELMFWSTGNTADLLGSSEDQ